MRDYKEETERRVRFIQSVLNEAGARGAVYGNSGGKDSALVGILLKKATDNVLGVQMPCGSKRNFQEDLKDGARVAEQYGIPTVTVNLTYVKSAFYECLEKAAPISAQADKNIAPRLRMAVLYALAASRSCLVAGTGNASEAYMGYFTKYGDGAYDFNPIADLTVTEVYEFLRYLGAPKEVLEKTPSAGLYDGQADEDEMGVTYREINAYLAGHCVGKEVAARIESAHSASAHKRRRAVNYGEEE